jgi:hypothetical protein
VLHTTDRFLDDVPDVTTVGWRSRVGPTQVAGTYAATVTLTATANP